MFLTRCSVMCVFVIGFPAYAEEVENLERSDKSAPVQSAETVAYPAVFFARYQPNTALDMVNQIPGFQLDDGGDARGFATSSGNILIDDRRLSAKQDLPSAILARIPAGQVERIELIRGQIRDIDRQGQSVVANLILSKVEKAAVRWRSSYRYNFDFGVTVEAEMSLADRWRAVEFNAGFDYRDFARGDFTPQDVLDVNTALAEARFDIGAVEGRRGGLNFNAIGNFGDTLVGLNTRVSGGFQDGRRISERTPQAIGSATRDEQFSEDLDNIDIEVGFDAQRLLRPDLVGKAIVLYFAGDDNVISSQRSLDSADILTRERISDTDTKTSETIARLELNWTGWADHAIQANLEAAFNTLDNTLLQTEDTGAGPVVVDVPGSNSRVEELRADLLLKDTWSLRQLEFEYGVGAEFSEITQTGDAELSRNFSFVKPAAALTYSGNNGDQTRLSLARDVSQLDFSDFVSASVFEDDDLALGNPDLRPETTWKLQLSHERRFASDSVIKLTVFHHWVTDVEDLLPLTETFEAPGNIGDGRRWGVEFESTLPLEGIGLTGAKLDINARWQDSSVTDPVTAADRMFSVRSSGGRLFPLNLHIENQYAFSVDFRQDFEGARFAWGWDVRARGERPFFKVNELDISDEATEFNMFVETTRWFGLKVRFAAENIIDAAERRDRIVYLGERDLSAVDIRELRARVRGFRVNLTASGNF